METKEILDEIYRLLQSQSDTAFPEFGFKRIHGGWEATTGKINAEEAKGHLYHYDNSPFCFVNHKTGENISLWKYVQSTRSNRETLEELARLANYTLPSLSGEDSDKIRERNERADLLESAQGFFTSELWSKWSKAGEKPLAYLKGRGYKEDEIRGAGLGCFPPQQNVEAYLASRGYSAEAVGKAGLKTGGFGSTHTVTIPYRDSVGRLKGFIVRATDPNVDPKYKLSAGTEKDELFNLHEARTERSLIVVEGFLDALVATARGVKGVVATGGSALTGAQLETVLRYKERSFILALDNDEAGREGTERSLARIYAKGARAYVVTLPEGFKDPDELISKKGVDAFTALLENAETGAKWTAKRLLSKYSIETDQGRDEALQEVLAFEDSLSDPIDSKDFLDAALPLLKIDLELLKPKLLEYHQQKDQDRLKARYGEILREGQKLLREGKVADLPVYLEEKFHDLQMKAVARTVESYTLDALTANIADTPTGLKTGYPTLDGFVTIPQGQLSIVAGRPSHGKTAFLMNLLLNAAKLYQEMTFLFLSYEESRRQVALKLLTILSQDLIDEKSNLFHLEAYLRGKNTNREKIEKGKAEYKTLVESGRLFVVDEPYHVDELADSLASLSEKQRVGAVFVDHIQKVKIKEKYQTRQIELQKVSEKLLETAKSLRLPIILGAQLSRSGDNSDRVRLEDLREAGDIAQDASLVLGLFDPAMQKAQDLGEVLRDRVVDLTVTVLKNRNGVVNEEAVLKFDRALISITNSKGPLS